MKWISVKDRLPERDKDVLFFCIRTNENGLKYLKYCITGTWNNTLRYLTANGENIYPISRIKDMEVTHWMPLPDPPEDI